MSDDELRQAAEHLTRLWQNDARTALISLELWPELADAIDGVGEALAPARARIHRDAAIRLQDLENGDVIRFNYPERNLLASYNGRPWAIEDAHPDTSRPRQNYWRITGWRPMPGHDPTMSEHFAMDEPGEEEVIWLGKLSDFPRSGLPGGWPE